MAKIDTLKFSHTEQTDVSLVFVFNSDTIRDRCIVEMRDKGFRISEWTEIPIFNGYDFDQLDDVCKEALSEAAAETV